MRRRSCSCTGGSPAAGLNWFNAFDRSSRRYDVVAPDLRGHGRGLRTRRRFRLADCADDVAAVLEQLDTGPVIAVGYSMGGPVAQLLWRRHPELVSGLVLCATSYRFVNGARERFIFGSMMATAVGTTRAGDLLAHGARDAALRAPRLGHPADHAAGVGGGGDAPPRRREADGGRPGHRELQRPALDRRDRRADHGA